MKYVTVPYSSLFNKNDFSCGNVTLDIYLQRQASQDIKRHLSACFVLLDESKTILGYYTLSNDSISQDLLPDAIKQKMPKGYINLPTTLIGRLAIDKKVKGKGLGKLLLLDSLKKCYDISMESIGSMAVFVDPIDMEAELFYRRYGFIKLPDSGRMFIAMKTLGMLFNK